MIRGGACSICALNLPVRHQPGSDFGYLNGQFGLDRQRGQSSRRSISDLTFAGSFVTEKPAGMMVSRCRRQPSTTTFHAEPSNGQELRQVCWATTTPPPSNAKFAVVTAPLLYVNRQLVSPAAPFAAGSTVRHANWWPVRFLGSRFASATMTPVANRSDGSVPAGEPAAAGFGCAVAAVGLAGRFGGRKPLLQAANCRIGRQIDTRFAAGAGCKRWSRPSWVSTQDLGCRPTAMD